MSAQVEHTNPFLDIPTANPTTDTAPEPGHISPADAPYSPTDTVPGDAAPPEPESVPEAGPSAAANADSAASAQAPAGDSYQTSREDVWYLKEILFRVDGQKRAFKIITQNFNGPCSLIAICNILILRGQIEILPHDRTTVSYEFLSQLLANHLLKNSPNVDISAALSKMPLTTKGMDLNPLFTGATRFRPAVDGGELELFDQAGIKLVHGWLIDPESPERAAVAHVEDYDTAVNLIVEADHLSNGQLVGDGAGPSQHSMELKDEDKQKIAHAYAVRSFLEQTQSQLTYHGLFTLASLLQPASLVALFRNSHLSVLYKSPGDDASLYTLVTDQVFLHEPSVVWERLEDVDQGASTFVDSDFRRSSPAGGDWAGYTAEGISAAEERRQHQERVAFAVADPADHELARQLQEEEDAAAQLAYARRQQDVQEQRELYRRAQKQAGTDSSEQRKKKKDCIIM
ncbi:DUF544-domain-containing protein [Dentipellis sp. KUC8613]|nr:DUF544-domain-containing protein [Dentipellis sp. KUC8613]